METILWSDTSIRSYPLRLWSQASANCWLVNFDAARFHSSRFNEASIACPAPIARSILKRQAEFFHGRLAARLALQALGLPPVTVQQGLQREPIWPDGVFGSISHNQRIAGAVTLKSDCCGPIGIDIETVVDGATVQDLIATVVDATELAYLKTLAAPLPLLLTIVFSAKEAFYKAAFHRVRRVFDFSALRTASVDLSKGEVQFEQREALLNGPAVGAYHRAHFHLLASDTVLTSYCFPPHC